MTPHTRKLNRLMAIVNPDGESHPAIDLAATLIADDGAIDLVTAIPPVPQLYLTIWPEEGNEVERERLVGAQTKLNEIANSRGSGVPWNTYVLRGRPFIEIIKLAQRVGYDMILTDDTVDDHVRDDPSQSDTNFRLLRKCPYPVWVVHSARLPVPKRIAAAVDVQDTEEEGAQLNEKILAYAMDIARRFEAELHIVQAWEFAGEAAIETKYGVEAAARHRKHYEERLEGLVQSLLQPLRVRGIPYELHLINGPPAPSIAACQESSAIDLIVMGTVGRSGVSGLLMGNTAEKILHSISCSVLAVKPDTFHSPIR
jgi:universal stress protein E